MGVDGSTKVPYTTSQLVDSPGRRVVSLASAGFPEIPVLGMTKTSCMAEGSAFHRHKDCMEITLCARGSAKFDCNDKVYTLLPGTVFMSMPHDVHRLRANLRGTRLFWVFLRLPPRGGTVLGLPPGESAHLLGVLRRVTDRAFAVPPSVKAAFEALFSAYDIPARLSARRSFELRAAAFSLFSAIVSGIRSGKPSRDHAEKAISLLIDRMRRFPEDDYSTDRLVEATSLSPNTVLSRFRKYTGLPPHAFLMKCRIRRACQLLSQGMTTTEVAARLSFASSQHLSTRFRQETGCSPQAWRKASVHQNAK